MLRKKETKSPKGKKILVGIGIGALAIYLLDPARGKARRLRREMERTGRQIVSDAEGVKERLTHLSSGDKDYDDVTLAQKVSSELFLDPTVPKERININAEGGVVVLRGEVDQSKDIKKIEKMVRKIDGVENVDNLLHKKGTPAPNKVPSRG